MSGRSGLTLADALDGVRWDFDAARQVLSPLAATARWFEDFPWDGEEWEARSDSGPSPRGERRRGGARESEG